MSRLRQSCIGMGLAAAILAAWLCLHIAGIFFFRPAEAPIAALLLVAIQTWLSVGLYIVAHDAMHGSLCPARRDLGDAVGTLALALYACFSFRRLLPKHHAHHRNPGSADDPDFAPASPSRAAAWYGRFLATYVSRREVLLMLARVGIYLLLGAQLENIVLFFALPGILSSIQLFYFGTFLPHRHQSGYQGSRFPDRHRSRSNDYGYLMSLLTCFHFGYHHEHHLEPGMPWWRLPALRRR
ncbi:beta-carotene ketolase (CrtW type) [Noviherbaspirillum humi]|uniref:Beta-carotene ketolase (CrtW type) n=1 Tax=Noviherbaspirillum humi TaxID=1688639 RepID=A0A239L4F8_9BURK|nr:fatty acid desaturase [Noviherbaspirillum humi]SNT24798.1 beta-carotene ketolase (CrtW type) [Noviherbaspirillum humi]